MVGVERDREQPDSRGPRRKGADRRGQVRELAVHVGAKIGQRAARVNERQHHHVSAQVRKPEGFTVLAGHREICNRVAGFQAFGLDAKLWRRPRKIEHQRSGQGRLHHSQVNKPVTLGLPVLLLDLELSLDLVARLHFFQDRRIVNAKRHGHCLHEADDLLMPNRDLPGLFLDFLDLANQPEFLDLRARSGCLGGLLESFSAGWRGVFEHPHSARQIMDMITLTDVKMPLENGVNRFRAGMASVSPEHSMARFRLRAVLFKKERPRRAGFSPAPPRSCRFAR